MKSRKHGSTPPFGVAEGAAFRGHASAAARADSRWVATKAKPSVWRGVRARASPSPEKDYGVVLANGIGNALGSRRR